MAAKNSTTHFSEALVALSEVYAHIEKHPALAPYQRSIIKDLLLDALRATEKAREKTCGL